MSKEKDSPVYKIHHFNFQVYMKQIDTYSDEHLENYGLVFSRNKRVDDITANDRILVTRTIMELSHLHERAIDFQIAGENPAQQVSLIYNIIQEFKSFMEVELNNNLLLTQEQVNKFIEDVVRVDNLGEQLHNVCKKIAPAILGTRPLRTQLVRSRATVLPKQKINYDAEYDRFDTEKNSLGLRVGEDKWKQ